MAPNGRGFLGVLRLVALICAIGHVDAAEPIQVLFIGNSYTYFNNLPEIFSRLAAQASERPVRATMVAAGGETLVSLWQRSRAREVLASARWDYVVLQCQSQLGDGLRDGKFVVNSPSLLHWGVRLFDAEIKRQGARTVLLLTWSRKDEPEQQADLNYAYDSVAREISAILAPVGPTWQRVRSSHPEMELYAKDGSHPSPLGSYLSAVVLVRALFPDAKGSLPTKIAGQAINSSGSSDGDVPQILVSLSPNDAEVLQMTASTAVQELRGNSGYMGIPGPSRPLAPQPKRQLHEGETFNGRWVGKLHYFPSPADVNLALELRDGKCEGYLTIKIPDRKQSFETPIAGCSTDENQLSFSVATLPIPFLIDRFTGWLDGESLAGSVERTGRELTNLMTGSWRLVRTSE
jgi:hypothetical protein